MRSQIQPPTRQPAAETMPPKTPVTSATVFADARHSPAMAESGAAPAPTGRKQRISASIPSRWRMTSQRSLNRLEILGSNPGGAGGGTGLGKLKSAAQHSRQKPPTTQLAIHGAGSRSARNN